jgi:hypothetical protein
MNRLPFLARAAQGERDFRWRGGDVSRLEALADAVFALSLTLIVVSLRVPDTFAEMVEDFRQLPVFAACFAILVWIWHGHFQFHRRYGLEDPLTIALNAALLFTVLAYIYPLRFLFGMLWNGMALGRGAYVLDELGAQVAVDGVPQRLFEGTSTTPLMLLYGLGFATVFGLLALMTYRAWRIRERLELDERERVITLATLRAHLISVGAAAVSCGIALLGGDWNVLAGVIYASLGPLHAWNGWRMGVRVAALRPGVEDAA